MRKTLLCMMAVLTVFSAFAASKSNIVTKKFDVEAFTGIKAGNGSEITISKSATCTLSITVDEEYLPYIKLVPGDAGVLSIEYAKLPFKMQNSKRSKMKIEVGVPYLNSLEVSGACKVSCADSFTPTSTMGEFVINCSGASTIDNLQVDAAKMEIDASGASKVIVSGKIGEIDAEISGATKMEVSGECGEFDVEVSGASNVNSEGLRAEDVEAEVSGASKASLFVLKSLKVEASGASSVTYIAEGQIYLDVEKISGASSFKRKDAK